VQELTLYDVETAIIMVPTGTFNLPNWTGKYIVSTPVMDHVVRKKIWGPDTPKELKDKTKGAEAVAAAYKRSYDAYHEISIEFGKYKAL
jgi:hypothetical protein